MIPPMGPMLMGRGLVPSDEAALDVGGGAMGEGASEVPLGRGEAIPLVVGAEVEGEGPMGALRPMTGEMCAIGCC